jgi:hypothetical protein
MEPGDRPVRRVDNDRTGPHDRLAADLWGLHLGPLPTHYICLFSCTESVGFVPTVLSLSLSVITHYRFF